MKEISSLVDSAIKKFTKQDFPLLKKDISSNLEFRLLFTIDLSKPFKEAKQDFLKNYLKDLLTLSLGNVSLAAKKANIHRRHLHRIMNEMKIDPNEHRKEMLKPSQYMKSYIYNIIDDTLTKSAVEEKKLQNIYTHLDDISEVISENIDLATFDEAMDLFEKEYIEKALKQCNGDMKKTSEFLEMSERTLYRKINKLNINI